MQNPANASYENIYECTPIRLKLKKGRGGKRIRVGALGIISSKTQNKNLVWAQPTPVT